MNNAVPSHYLMHGVLLLAEMFECSGASISKIRKCSIGSTSLSFSALSIVCARPPKPRTR